jgi:hypothetical protein
MDDAEASELGSTLNAEAQAALAALERVRLDIVSDILTFNRRKRLLAGMLVDAGTIKNALAEEADQERPA